MRLGRRVLVPTFDFVLCDVLHGVLRDKHLRQERNLPKGTSARYIDKPRVDTLRVELVVAWQHPQILTLDKVVGTDRAGEVTAIGGSVGI